MSTDSRVHHAEQAITQTSNGDGFDPVRQPSRTFADKKNRTIAEKEVEAGEDERDIRRKQVCLAPPIVHQVDMTDAGIP